MTTDTDTAATPQAGESGTPCRGGSVCEHDRDPPPATRAVRWSLPDFALRALGRDRSAVVVALNPLTHDFLDVLDAAATAVGTLERALREREAELFRTHPEADAARAAAAALDRHETKVRELRQALELKRAAAQEAERADADSTAYLESALVLERKLNILGPLGDELRAQAHAARQRAEAVVAGDRSAGYREGLATAMQVTAAARKRLEDGLGQLLTAYWVAKEAEDLIQARSPTSRGLTGGWT